MPEQTAVRLLIIRHAQAQHEGDDPRLSEAGRSQAEALAVALKREAVDRVISSTMRRAVETARFICPDGSFETDDQLREFDFGPSQPPSYQMAEERSDLELWRPEHGPDGGETLRTFQARVSNFLEHLVATTPSGSTIALVTHAGVIDASVRWAIGATPDMPWTAEVDAATASVTELVCWPRGRRPGAAPRYVVIQRLGDVGHLPPRLVTGY